MKLEKITRYRLALEELARQVGDAAQNLEETARAPTGGEAGGSLPMHLGDVGSEVYTQELNATLLENEEFIGHEAADALRRIDQGLFGKCEECGAGIPEGRLDALPYARYCVACAEKLHSGSDANLNTGRPAGWGSTLEHPAALAGRSRAGERSPTNAPRKEAAGDQHAAGTPGGGSALGGLGGSNTGDGDPDGDLLEGAMGSGSYDAAAEGDEAEPGDGFSGPTGGAVGGSPANKRSVGGNMHNPAPRPSQGDGGKR